MPSKLEHVTKADGNAAFALSLTLDNQTRIDWALVALFYAAMNYVEAYLATSNQDLRSHTTRDRMPYPQTIKNSSRRFDIVIRDGTHRVPHSIAADQIHLNRAAVYPSVSAHTPAWTAIDPAP